MNQSAINERKRGVTFKADQQATIVIWAPQANEVALSINNHALFLPLTKASNGYWQLTTDQLKPGDTYTFVLDGEKELADPASLLQPQGIYGPSQAYDLTHFYWEDSSWVNPPIDDYIVYGIDIHTFTQEGTLNAIIRKLSHLKKLGVNAILIRPVTDFPDSQHQRSDAAFLFAVQASFGGPGQLQQVVNACHFEGLAVILDLSYKRVDQPNQLIREPAGYIARRRPTDQSATRIGTAVYQEAYRHYLVDNALMWFRDFHVDGLRLENVYAVPDADQLLSEIRERTNGLTAQTGRQYYLLVEQDVTLLSNDVKKAVGIEHSDQRTSANCNSYYMDFTHNRHKAKQYRTDCLCNSSFSAILQELFDREIVSTSSDAFVTILQTYRQPDVQTEQRIDSEFLKLVAGSIMVSPCIPTLFMGEEWGVTNPLDTESHAASVLPWEMLNERPNQTLYKYHQSLTALRRQQPALNHLNSNQVQILYQEGEPTLLLNRAYKTNDVLCLMNFSPEKQSVTLPSLGKSWQKLLDSADPIWSGPGSSPESLPNASTVSLYPTSILIYKARL